MLRLALVCLLVSACIPHPGGQCAALSDCGFGTTCQSGLCQRPPLASPEVTWLTPDDGSWHASGSLALSFTAPGQSAQVLAQSGSRSIAIPLSRSGPGFSGQLDVSLFADGDLTLVPELDGAQGRALLLHLDRAGPAVTLTLPVPPAGAFRRDQTIEVRARIQDRGVGLDPASPLLVAQGIAPIPGRRVSALEWSFLLPLSGPVFSAAQGPIGLRILASDRLGNLSGAEGAVPVTRLLWSTNAGRSLPIRSSAALDAAHLYLGTDAGAVVALDRRTGVQLWSRALSGPVSASPAIGQLVYAASEGGDLVALDPNTGEPRWSCPALTGVLQFHSSPALRNAADGEQIFLANSSAVQQGNLTVQGGLVEASASGCSAFGAFGGGLSSPAISADGTLYVGGLDARVHAVRFEAGVFRELWSAKASDDTSLSPALGDGGNVLAADESGGILWFSSTGTLLGSGALGEKLLASPVLAFTSAIALGRDGSLVPFEGPGPARSAATPFYVAQQLPSAGGISATPAVGQDGTLYVAAGRSVRALAPGGALLWEQALPGAATSSSPALACDGTLYVGDGLGNVLALATDSAGLAPGGWPKFRHDERNSGNATSPLCASQPGLLQQP